MGEANLTATVLYFFNTEHCNNLIDQCNIVRQNTCIEMFNCIFRITTYEQLNNILHQNINTEIND